MYELSDKVVLITGGANGIGEAVVRELVEQGTKCVTILDIDEEKGLKLQNEINKKYEDPKIEFVKCDVADEKQLHRAFEGAAHDNEYIDLVINNAAILDESTYQNIRKQVEVNVTAVINGTLKALELMRINKGGRGGTVINISSIAALIRHSPLLFVYTATKSAVMQFSNCIGMEPYCSATGVRIITICFGNTKTNIFQNMNSFDDSIDMKTLMELYPMQSPQWAALGTIEAFRKGESGSTWLINNGKPAKDISSTVNHAFDDMSKVLADDS